MIKEGSLRFGDLGVTTQMVYAAMGYGYSVPETQIQEVINDVLFQARECARPSYMFRFVQASQIGLGLIEMDGCTFHIGKIINSYLAGMDEACVFVTTAGTAYDNFLISLKRDGDILREFVADAIGSVIAEATVDYVGNMLNSLSNKPHSLPYSPGYCAWNIKEQQILFPLLPDNPCGVFLSDSCLMSPVKSVSGFFALGDALVPQPYKCEICTNTMCYKRRLKK